MDEARFKKLLQITTTVREALEKIDRQSAGRGGVVLLVGGDTPEKPGDNGIHGVLSPLGVNSVTMVRLVSASLNTLKEMTDDDRFFAATNVNANDYEEVSKIRKTVQDISKQFLGVVYALDGTTRVRTIESAMKYLPPKEV